MELKKQLTIINKLGLHARAASKLVATASKFQSSIQINRSGQQADAKSIMSVLMLAAILYIYGKAGTFDYPAILLMMETGKLALTHLEETLLFLAFFLAFAIKVPLFPLHTWLPHAHVQRSDEFTIEHEHRKHRR